MNPMALAFASPGAILLLFGFAGVWLPDLLDLQGMAVWWLRGILWAAGLGLAVYIFLILRARAKAQPRLPKDDEVDAAIDAARRRLPGNVRLGRAPVVLVVGPGGAAKTTIVQRSGLDPELLAGEVERDQAVVPSLVNVWYSDGTILTEVGGRLLEDEKRWGRVLERLEPARLAAMLPGGRQAPRVAIVCLSCEELAKAGAAQTTVSQARAIRQRLMEAAQQFGVRLPVYVVFTKADRLPYFTDYVRSFTAEEAREVLGTTLPIESAGDAGRYKEAANARLQAAFDRILHTLSLRRLDVLPRESTEEVRSGAYEFPRELGKAAVAAREFLVELCRPGQIGLSPFLRGFYFTGVRPVVVSEAQRPVAPPEPTRGGAVDATSVFDPRAMLAAARKVTESGSRRIPDWTFLPGIFRRVVLQDRVAMGLTEGGRQVAFWRRAVFAALTVVSVLLSFAFVVSWLANRALVEEARVAAEAVQSVDLSGVGLPTSADLVRLDSLRRITAQLRAWDTTAPPRSHRWGLYAGDDLLPELRNLYFHRFRRMLWQGTRGNLTAFLAALPDTATTSSEYESAFGALKGYLITTQHPELSTPAFLTPVLVRHWGTAREVEDAVADLATLQFAFFSTELPYGNPNDDEADAALIEHARDFLADYNDSERLYQAVLSLASDSAAAIRFHEAVPGSEAVMRNEFVVPGAFTRRGWDVVQANVNNVDSFFASDEWVLGSRTVSTADRQRLADSVRVKYRADYVRTWSDFLAATQILSYGRNARVAATNLGIFSNNDSPLLRLFAITADNTAVDTTDVGGTFQPVRLIVDANSPTLVNPRNGPYVGNLAQLAASMDAVAEASGPARTGAAAQAENSARQAEGTVSQLAREFSPTGGAAAVGRSVRTLLDAPIGHVDQVLRGIDVAEINGNGASFCAVAGPVLRKYPFDPASGTNATVDDLNRVFRPTESALAALKRDLQNIIEPIGNEYRARSGVERSPTQQFLDMLNRMDGISRAFYPDNAREPGFSYLLTPQLSPPYQELTFSLHGQNHTVSERQFLQLPFSWRPGDDTNARISGGPAGGPSSTLVSRNEPWATFRLFAIGEWNRLQGSAWRVTWRVTNGTVSADLLMNGRPILDPAMFRDLSCESNVVR